MPRAVTDRARCRYALVASVSQVERETTGKATNSSLGWECWISTRAGATSGSIQPGRPPPHRPRRAAASRPSRRPHPGGSSSALRGVRFRDYAPPTPACSSDAALRRLPQPDAGERLRAVRVRAPRDRPAVPHANVPRPRLGVELDSARPPAGTPAAEPERRVPVPVHTLEARLVELQSSPSERSQRRTPAWPGWMGPSSDEMMGENLASGSSTRRAPRRRGGSRRRGPAARPPGPCGWSGLC